MLLIPDFPSTTLGVLWDISQVDRNVFVAFDSKVIMTFIHLRDSIDGLIFELFVQFVVS